MRCRAPNAASCGCVESLSPERPTGNKAFTAPPMPWHLPDVHTDGVPPDEHLLQRSEVVSVVHRGDGDLPPPTVPNSAAMAITLATSWLVISRTQAGKPVDGRKRKLHKTVFDALSLVMKPFAKCRSQVGDNPSDQSNTLSAIP